MVRGAAQSRCVGSRSRTATAFARLVGLHRTHLSDLLAGRANPGPRTRRRLLEALNVEFDDLFEVGDVRCGSKAQSHPLAEGWRSGSGLSSDSLSLSCAPRIE